MQSHIPPLYEYCSSRNPLHQIQYTHLNPGAQHTLVLCYGAGGRAIDSALYQPFLHTHPELSLLTVDRWTLPSQPRHTQASKLGVSREGLGLLSELTSITVELLDTLSIGCFSVAAHSAGAYQMLDLVKRCAEHDRVKSVFPISTHIPPSFLSSNTLLWMSKAPDFIFNSITKLDTMIVDSPSGRLLRSLFAKQEPSGGSDTIFVDTEDLRQALAAYKPTPKQRALLEERISLDYSLAYARLPGVLFDDLTGLYLGLRVWPHVNVTWFTCEGDIFFGPTNVRTVADAMAGDRRIDIVDVPRASHADIFRRKQVWEQMYVVITRDDNQVA